jgi:hypothetical protein
VHQGADRRVVALGEGMRPGLAAPASGQVGAARLVQREVGDQAGPGPGRVIVFLRERKGAPQMGCDLIEFVSHEMQVRQPGRGERLQRLDAGGNAQRMRTSNLAECCVAHLLEVDREPLGQMEPDADRGIRPLVVSPMQVREEGGERILLPQTRKLDGLPSAQAVGFHLRLGSCDLLIELAEQARAFHAVRRE